MLDVADSQIIEVGDARCEIVLEKAAETMAGSSVGKGGDGRDESLIGSNQQGVIATPA